MLREPMALDLYGPNFLDRSELLSHGRKKRNRICTAASTRSCAKALPRAPTAGREAFKALDMNITSAA